MPYFEKISPDVSQLLFHRLKAPKPLHGYGKSKVGEPLPHIFCGLALNDAFSRAKCAQVAAGQQLNKGQPNLGTTGKVERMREKLITLRCLRCARSIPSARAGVVSVKFWDFSVALERGGGQGRPSWSCMSR